MKLNPLNSNIVIKIDTEKVEEVNGILLAPTAAVIAKPNIGTVVAVHPNNPIVEVGQKVMFLKHSGTGYKEDPLDKNSPDYKVLSEKDILGIVEDGNYG